MNEEVRRITKQLQDERTAGFGNVSTPDGYDADYLSEFGHAAAEMLSSFIEEMVERGAPGAKLIPVTSEMPRSSLLGAKAINRLIGSTKTKRKLLSCTEVPGWRLGFRKSTNYSILATNEVIRENWTTDKGPTTIIAPENYGTVLADIGIKSIEDLQERLIQISDPS